MQMLRLKDDVHCGSNMTHRNGNADEDCLKGRKSAVFGGKRFLLRDIEKENSFRLGSNP